MLINILSAKLCLSSYNPLPWTSPSSKSPEKNRHVYVLKIFHLSTSQSGFCIQHLIETILASITKSYGYFSKEIFCRFVASVRWVQCLLTPPSWNTPASILWMYAFIAETSLSELHLQHSMSFGEYLLNIFRCSGVECMCILPNVISSCRIDPFIIM